MIEQTELAVAIRLTGVRGGVFLPQQHERHALALELLVQVRKIGHGMTFHQRRGAGKEQRLELSLVRLRRQRPSKPCCLRSTQIFGYRPLGDPRGSGNAFVA